MADPSPPSHVWFALALISLIAHWGPVHTVLPIVPHRIVPLASASSGGSRGKLLFLISHCLPLTSNSDLPRNLEFHIQLQPSLFGQSCSGRCRDKKRKLIHEPTHTAPAPTPTPSASSCQPAHPPPWVAVVPEQLSVQAPAAGSLYFIRPPVYLQMYDLARAPASAPASIPAPAPGPGCPAAAAPAFCRRLRRCCCPRVLGMNE
ncbi:hypothetical protein K456DRAFT_1755757 [Colletotrichum gloeosporioides 23]|nr:hypothetical protein K456DRAFT_1755757 [Colletotrichum gloeosporioides 23]